MALLDQAILSIRNTYVRPTDDVLTKVPNGYLYANRLRIVIGRPSRRITIQCDVGCCKQALLPR